MWNKLSFFCLNFIKLKTINHSLVVVAFNTSIWEAEAGRLLEFKVGQFKAWSTQRNPVLKKEKITNNNNKKTLISYNPVIVLLDIHCKKNLQVKLYSHKNLNTKGRLRLAASQSTWISELHVQWESLSPKLRLKKWLSSWEHWLPFQRSSVQVPATTR